ncbi:MAG TPA: hypothetical protein VIR54_27050 [Vicinamibacterales bacterium]
MSVWIIASLQLAIVGLLLWLVRCFGAFVTIMRKRDEVWHREMSNFRDEVRKFREHNETLHRQKSA